MEKIDHESMDVVVQKFQAAAHVLPRILSEFSNLRTRLEELADEGRYIRGLHIDRGVVDRADPITGMIVGKSFIISLQYVFRDSGIYGKCTLWQRVFPEEKPSRLGEFLIDRNGSYLQVSEEVLCFYAEDFCQTKMVLSIIKEIAEQE